MNEKHQGDEVELDRAIARAGELIAPRTARLEADLAGLVAVSRARTRAPRAPHRLAWTVALGILFTGGAAAAAAAGAGWAPWAADPDVAFTYSLPSGLVCEQRIGVLDGGDPAARSAIRDIVVEVDVVGVADVDSRESELRDDPTFMAYAEQAVESERAERRTVDDVVREAAIGDAVVEVLERELSRRGFDTEAPEDLPGLQGQAMCEQAAR